MFARVPYALAALAFIVSLLGLRSETRDVMHYPGMLAGEVPIIVYEPGEPRGPFSEPEFEIRLPVVVLAHGFTGNAPMMSSIARTLARRGYAVVALEFRGHGHNDTPFGTRASDGRGGLNDDLERAVEFARTQPHFDPERVALIGHSMGAFASLDYASWDPSVAAAVLISGGGGTKGPHRPPNTLFIWAAGDPQPLREGAAQRAAELAELERLVLGKTYGDLDRGTGVRTSEVPGVDHLTILNSSVAWERIADWLALTMGPGTAPRGDPSSDGRYGWTLLGVLSFLVLLWGGIGALTPLVPNVPLQVAASPLRALAELGGVLVLAVLLLTGIDGAGFGGPLGLVPLTVTRDFVTFQFTAGLLLVVYLVRTGRLSMNVVSLGATAGALLLFAGTYLALGSFVSVYDGLWLAPHRAALVPLVALLMLPFYLGFECLLRSARSARPWLPILGRMLVLAVIALGALTQLLPGFLILAVGGFTLSFTLFEFVAFRAAREVPNPWTLAVYQALMSAWTQSALFPFEGN